MDSRSEPARLQLLVAYASFFAMGLGGGLLTVAWPSIRANLGRGLGATGALFAFESAGYMLYSLPSGWLIARFGLGPVLLFGAAARGIGLLGYGLASSWGSLLATALIGGVGTGTIDAGLNTYFAARCRASHTTRLHASCGLGAMAGPVLMTTVLSLGWSWRAAYAIAAVVQGLLAIAFAGTARGWNLAAQAGPATGRPHGASGTRMREVVRLPTVWLLATMFFVATGVKVAGGQWPYSVFTEARLIPPATASIWTSIYFGCVLTGRLLAGAIVERLGIARTLRVAMVGALAGAALLSLDAADTIAFVGLALLGLAVGPVFSLLVAGTRRSVGADRAAHTIGLGMTSAVLGVAGVQGLAGLLAEEYGLQVVGPVLTGATAILLLLHEFVARVRQPGVLQAPARPQETDRC